MDDEKENSNRVKFSGIILPWLEHLYKLFLDPFIKTHNLIIDDEFWFFLSFSIFSGILYFTKVNIWVPLGFFVGAIIVLILHNSKYIRRRIFPKEAEKIDDFLNNLKFKTQDELIIFIKSYQLETNQILKIIEYKKNNYDIYLFIRKYQLINSELLEYFISNELYKVMGPELFSQFIILSLDHISKKNYDLLRKSTNNKDIIKSLNLCYPFYLKNHPTFKFFANIFIKIRTSINYEGLKFGILILSLVIMIFIASKDPSLLRIVPSSSKMALLTQITGNIFAFIMSVGILTLIFLLIIKGVLRLFRFIVCLFAPVDNNG